MKQISSLLFLIVLSMSLTGLACSSNEPILTGDDKVIAEKSFQAVPGGYLDVSMTLGNIKINNWDKNEVKFVVYGNEKTKENFNFEMSNSGDKYILKMTPKSQSNKNYKNYSASVEVYIPKIFNSEAKTAGGNIEIGDATGSVTLVTAGGNVKLGTITGSVDVKTAGGDIVANKTYGSTDLKTSGGNIIVKDSEGDLSLSTAGGNITINAKNGVVKAATSGGNVDLTYLGENQGINLTTSGGNVKAKLPSAIKGSINIRTASGKVDCALPVEGMKKSETSLSGNLNGGGKEIRLTSSGGDVIIVK